jgi:hypothetical protein
MAVTTIGQLIESIRLLFPEGRVPKNLKTAGFCGSQRLKLKRLTLLDDITDGTAVGSNRTTLG